MGKMSTTNIRRPEVDYTKYSITITILNVAIDAESVVENIAAKNGT